MSKNESVPKVDWSQTFQFDDVERVEGFTHVEQAIVPLQKLRVLHVYRTYFPESQGGLEEAIRQLCYSLKKCGVESRVLATTALPNPGKWERDEAFLIQVKKQLEIASCSMSVGLLQEYRKQAQWADVINVHYPWPFADLIHILSGVNKPLVITYHSDIVRQRVLNFFYSPLRNLFFRSADQIVATSPNYFASSDCLQKYASKTSIIPLGIAEETYDTELPEDRQYVVDTYRKPFFLFIGVLRYYKGLHILIDAAKGLDADIIIAGAGPMEKKLRDQAQHIGLDNVHFLGHISNSLKVALFKNSAAVVFPSHLRSEAFGVTLLEGAMYSKALISTELGTGTTHVNIHGETGFVVAPANHKALHEAMKKILADPALALRMGRQARLRFEKLFSGGVLARNYLDLYRNVFSRNGVRVAVKAIKR